MRFVRFGAPEIFKWAPGLHCLAATPVGSDASFRLWGGTIAYASSIRAPASKKVAQRLFDGAFPLSAGCGGRGSPYAAPTLPPFSFNAARQFGDSGGVALRRQFEMPPWGAGFARASRRAFQAFLRTALELQGVFGGGIVLRRMGAAFPLLCCGGASAGSVYGYGPPQAGGFRHFFTGRTRKRGRLGGSWCYPGLKARFLEALGEPEPVPPRALSAYLSGTCGGPFFWRAGRFELQLPLR